MKEDTGARTIPGQDEQIVARVRERYGRIATGEEGPIGGCCPRNEPGVEANAAAHRVGYADDELALVPDGANLGLGCGAPVRHLELRPGETVVDLGSGGGLDAFLAAKEVGAAGRVIGVDMTEEMIERARDNARRARVDNVEFRHGRLEALPVDDASVDAVTSNCVINLVPDKARVFREVARVLRPGGRLVVSDIVLDAPLPDALAQDLLAYVGCVAGAMLRDDYFARVRDAGLGRVEVVRDVDGLSILDDPEGTDLPEVLRSAGVDPAEVRGKIRSVTYRAFKA